MSKHDDLTSLKDMLSHSREAVQLLGNLSADQLAQERVVQLALTRLMEIIGESAKRVSGATQVKHPEIPARVSPETIDLPEP